MSVINYSNYLKNYSLEKTQYDRELMWVKLMLKFENIAVNIFKWGFENSEMPLALRSAYIERELFNRGEIVCLLADFEKEQTNGILFLPLARGGEINVYSELTNYNAISPRGTFFRSINDAVLIRNNELRVATRYLIDDLVFDLADLKIARRVNRNASLKTPATFVVEDKTQLTALNIYQKISGNRPVILQSAGAPPRQINQVDPYLGKQILDEETAVRNEILTTIGVLTNPVEKAERVNTVEATSNRGEIIDTIDGLFQSRLEACEQINRMFADYLQSSGLGKIYVKINNEYIKNIVEQGVIDGSGAADDSTDGEGGNE